MEELNPSLDVLRFTISRALALIPLLTVKIETPKAVKFFKNPARKSGKPLQYPFLPPEVSRQDVEGVFADDAEIAFLTPAQYPLAFMEWQEFEVIWASLGKFITFHYKTTPIFELGNTVRDVFPIVLPNGGEPLVVVDIKEKEWRKERDNPNGQAIPNKLIIPNSAFRPFPEKIEEIHPRSWLQQHLELKAPF